MQHFKGRNFLETKENPCLYISGITLSFIFLGWYDGWYNNRSSYYCSCSPMCVSEWESKIYILFLLLFFVLFFGNCSMSLVFVFFLPFLEVVEIHPYFEWRWVSDPSVLVSSVWVSVVSEHGDWLVFLVSEWLVDDVSVGGRGWGAAGKPTIPKCEAPVV